MAQKKAKKTAVRKTTKVVKTAKGNSKKFYFALLMPFKNRIIKYLTSKNIKFDPYNDSSIYYEFYKSVSGKESIDTAVPQANKKGYDEALKNVDWKSVFETIKGFFTDIFNAVQKKKVDGEEITDTEKELVIDVDDLNKNVQKKNDVPTPDKKISLPVMLIGGLILYNILK